MPIVETEIEHGSKGTQKKPNDQRQKYEAENIVAFPNLHGAVRKHFFQSSYCFPLLRRDLRVMISELAQVV
jgi:hypothetical protein